MCPYVNPSPVILLLLLLLSIKKGLVLCASAPKLTRIQKGSCHMRPYVCAIVLLVVIIVASSCRSRKKRAGSTIAAT